MARSYDARFDFRKGLNRVFSQETTDRHELRNAGNARVGQQYGSVAKRAGTKRVHTTAVGGGAPVLGLFQWTNPAGARQLVAICNGDLYHKIEGATEFTEVAGSFSTTVKPTFAVHRVAGAPTLYIADGTLRSFNGSAISAVAGAPAGLRRIAEYKKRLFGAAGPTSSTLYWSKVLDPTVWAAPDGGSAPVNVYDSEGIVALEKVGSSLLPLKGNTIARYTGVSSDNIRIDQESHGVSGDYGVLAAESVLRVEQRVFLVSDRGPIWASEAGTEPAGIKVEPAFDAFDPDLLVDAVAANHRRQREVWVYIGATGYCLNYRLNSWTGPWELPFDVVSAARFEQDDRTESVYLGGDDGFVRQADVGTKDDVLLSGSGGTNITLDLELPTLMFGDPTSRKCFTDFQEVAADLGASGELQIIFNSDLFGEHTQTIESLGAGVKQYPFRIPSHFNRGTLTLREATSEIVQINGLVLQAGLSRR